MWGRKLGELFTLELKLINAQLGKVDCDNNNNHNHNDNYDDDVNHVDDDVDNSKFFSNIFFLKSHKKNKKKIEKNIFPMCGGGSKFSKYFFPSKLTTNKK